MPQINCKINLMLIWKAYCVVSSATGVTKIAINNAKLFVPVVILPNQDNENLLQELKSTLKEQLIRRLSPNIIRETNGDTTYETNLPHKSLLTDRQVSKACKPFRNS